LTTERRESSMNDYFTGPRYITQGIQQALDPLLINFLWRLLDHFMETSQLDIDYLQIFNVQTISKQWAQYLSINHHQEVPDYIYETTVNYETEYPLNEKIYIISSMDEEGKEYSTMLLASEY
jgi:Staphylococcal protein of unknown function (DUF960)